MLLEPLKQVVEAENWWENAAFALSSIYVDYEKLGKNRQGEANRMAEEISIVKKYKAAFDVALLLIKDGFMNRWFLK